MKTGGWGSLDINAVNGDGHIERSNQANHLAHSGITSPRKVQGWAARELRTSEVEPEKPNATAPQAVRLVDDDMMFF